MTIQFLFTGLTTGAIYALIAIGFCVVHNATGIVNFAQVDFVTLGGMLLYTFLHQAGLPMWLDFPLTVVGVALIGGVLERLTLRPARSDQVLILIFITIGASILLRGGMEHVWGRSSLAVRPISLGEPLEVLGAAVMPQSLWVMALTGLCVAVLAWYFRRTRPGKAMRAVADNPKAASLVGIDVAWMKTLAFAISGGVGALAGMLIVPITTLAYDVGVMIGLKGFAAAVLGGYGHFLGAILGGLALGVVESMGAGLISSTYKDVIAFVILLLVLFLRPSGLLGTGAGERV